MISQDDLVVGMYFTIDSWKPKGVPPGMEGMPLIFGQPEAKWGMGEIFRVKAIQLPFIAVECLSVPNLGDRVFPLDVREVNLIKINEKYVKALRLTKSQLQTQSKRQPNSFEELFGEMIIIPPESSGD